MGINRSPLPKKFGYLTLPFFVIINQYFSLIICINGCICILTGSPGKYFSWRYILYEKLGVQIIQQLYQQAVNYHYRSENMEVTICDDHVGTDNLLRVGQQRYYVSDVT